LPKSDYLQSTMREAAEAEQGSLSLQRDGSKAAHYRKMPTIAPLQTANTDQLQKPDDLGKHKDSNALQECENWVAR